MYLLDHRKGAMRQPHCRSPPQSPMRKTRLVSVCVVLWTTFCAILDTTIMATTVKPNSGSCSSAAFAPPPVLYRRPLSSVHRRRRINAATGAKASSSYSLTSVSPIVTWQPCCMATSGSSSKTGGRLLESAEEYYTFMDHASRSGSSSSTSGSSGEPRPVLVFWTAPWCGPCRLSVPVVKDIIKLYHGKIDAVEVCTDDLPEVASDAGVESIPTIHIYFGGKLVDTLVGCVAKQVLAGSVEKVLEDIAIKQKGAPRKNFEDMAP